MVPARQSDVSSSIRIEPSRHTTHRRSRIGAVDHVDDRDSAADGPASDSRRRDGLCDGAGRVEQLLSDRSCIHHYMKPNSKLLSAIYLCIAASAPADYKA